MRTPSSSPAAAPAGSHPRASGSACALAAALAGLALLAGCGGGSKGPPVADTGATAATPAGTTSTASEEQALLDFSRCMRKHGVASFPDPRYESNGAYGFANLSELRQLVRGNQQALVTCEPIIARSGILSTQNIARFAAQMLVFARCMRSHGEAAFPDPNANGRFGGQLGSLDRNSPAFQTALTACRPELAAAIGVFSVGGSG
jgi:hypothetical protein